MNDAPNNQSTLEKEKKYEEDDETKKQQILETQYANLGTVSEISLSNHEFDFSSIDEFKDSEK